MTETLNFLPSELTGQSLFDILHPKDISKIKEQLTSSDIGTRDRLVDPRTLLPLAGDFTLTQSLSRIQSGARRMFLCRMKSKQVTQHSIVF